LGELGGLNLYGFVRNQPIAVVDLFGLCPTKQDCDKAYDNAMQKAKQAGLDCLVSGIEWGIVGEVILGGGGTVVGAIAGAPAGGIGAAPGAGIGLVIGTGVNLIVDFVHLHHCEKKIDKMKQDAKKAHDDCLKQANQGQANQVGTEE
jgi:hypothetical protein